MSILLLISLYISANDDLLNRLLKNTSPISNTVATNIKEEDSDSMDFSKPLKITWSHCITDSRIRNVQKIISEKYMTLHPNIKIQIIAKHPLDYYDWLKAKVAAADEPDIVTVDNIFDRSMVGLRERWFVNMSTYLEKTNPYTGVKWKYEFMQQNSWNRLVAGSYYTFIPSLPKTTKFIYNKEHFEKAGIKDTPKTWREFIDILKILNENEYIPFGLGIKDSYEQIFLLCNYITDHIYYPEVNEIDVFYRDGVIQMNEMIRAMEMGLIDPRNAEMITALKLFKKFSDYWSDDYVNTTDYDAKLMFVEGKASIILGSSWELPEYLNKGNLKWSSFSFPVITSDDLPSSNNRAMEPEALKTAYAVSRSAVRRKTADYCADFLMTFTSYEASTVLDENFSIYRYDENYIPNQSKNSASKKNYEASLRGEIMPNATPLLYTFDNRDIQNEVCQELVRYIKDEISEEEFLDIREKNTLIYVNKLKKIYGWSHSNDYGNDTDKITTIENEKK